MGHTWPAPEAVNDELARHRGEGVSLGRDSDRPTGEPGSRHENGYENNPENGLEKCARQRPHEPAERRRASQRPATARQLDYAGQLAVQIGGLGTQELETLVGRLFGKPLANLTSLEASSLIDTLRAIKTGEDHWQVCSTGRPRDGNRTELLMGMSSCLWCSAASGLRKFHVGRHRP